LEIIIILIILIILEIIVLITVLCIVLKRGKSNNWFVSEMNKTGMIGLSLLAILDFDAAFWDFVSGSLHDESIHLGGKVPPADGFDLVATIVDQDQREFDLILASCVPGKEFVFSQYIAFYFPIKWSRIQATY